MDVINFPAKGARGGNRDGGDSNNVGETKCGRWNPTSEQLKVLTDLFRSGLRTPSTEQIRRISSQLSYYGKIESKNVFYWFQNHKARERQKRQRVSIVDGNYENHHHQHHQHRQHHQHHQHHDEISQATYKHSGEGDRSVVWDDGVVSEGTGNAIETLQLFPLTAVEQSLLLREHECKEIMPIAYRLEGGVEHMPLDLRLSFH